MWPYGKRVFIGVIKGRSLRGDHSGLSGWALNYITNVHPGLPRWHSGKESASQRRRYKRGGFDPWVGKIPWSRKWQSAPVFLPGKFHGQRRLVGAKSQTRQSAHTVLLRETQRRDTQGEAGEGHVEMQQGWEWCGHKPRNTGATRNRGSQDIFFTRAFGRSLFLLTPWFQASGLHNDVRINSTVLKLPALQ